MFLVRCTRCGVENQITEQRCKRCATPVSTEGYEFRKRPSIDAPTLFGLAGAATVFVGVFTPAISVPILGNINYLSIGSGEGVVVLVLSLISVVLVLARKRKGLFLTGGLSLAMLAFSFLNFQYRMSQGRSTYNPDNPVLKGVGDALVGSIQLQWGWAVLSIGSIAILLSAVLRSEFEPTPESFFGKSAAVFREDRTFLAAVFIPVLFGTGIILSRSILPSNALQSLSTHVYESIFSGSSASSMDNSIRVEFVSKEFKTASIETDYFFDAIHLKLRIINTSEKDIIGFKGRITFYDMFDNILRSVELNNDQTIRAGDRILWSGFVHYSPLAPEDRKLREASTEKLRFRFEPHAIYFADGSRLGNPR